MSVARRPARTPGPSPETDKRVRFLALIGRGVSNAEACRLVGVNRRTGTRWRFGRVTRGADGVVREYGPVDAPAIKPLSNRYLSQDERTVIADQVRAGVSLNKIAQLLGRSPSTVSREVQRNADASGRYTPYAAHQRALRRLRRTRQRRVEQDRTLCSVVQRWLDARWSPEQVAAALRLRHPDKISWHLCTESIYQALYDPATPLQRSADECLRTRRRRRRPRRNVMGRAARPGNMRPLDQRPQGANDRSESGHWEGDLILGAGNRSAIGTLVERVSRYVMLVHLEGRHTTETTCQGISDSMSVLPPHLRRSLAWDQGTEMAGHERITDAIGLPVFFCEARSPWQRPTNENSNGLLRDYFPKGTNLARHSPADLKRVQDELNDRPRKCLKWQTPAEVLQALQSVQQ